MAEGLKLSPTPLQQFTLANGLRVILCEDHAVPVVSVALYYDVGSRNEKIGRTGFAHLFEHMMFQGSENVPKAAHFQYIFNAGGTMNGRRVMNSISGRMRGSRSRTQNAVGTTRATLITIVARPTANE